MQQIAARGERGCLLDGFPRTEAQARTLMQTMDVQLAINLHLREDVRSFQTATF